MYSLPALAFVSFFCSLVLTPLCRDAFRRLGLVDRPDGARKLHRDPIPRGGGVPIAMSYLASFGVLLLMPLNAGDLIERYFPQIVLLLPAVGLVFVTGLLDDLMGLRPWQKLVCQIGAASLA